MSPPDVVQVLSVQAECPEASQWSARDLDTAALPPSTKVYRYTGWVISSGQDIISGFLIFRATGDSYEILNMGVRPAFRRKGLASRLLRSFFSLPGVQQSRVFLEVRCSNDGAIAFYERHGFREVARRKEYYSNPREDALVLAYERPVNGV
jgi:ribosomal-protein-alanine N-acetyltransferase